MEDGITIIDRLFRFPGHKELYSFFIQLYSYLRSGTDIVSAVSNIAEITENKILRNSLYRIVRYLEDGNTVAEAFAKEDKIFPRYIIATIHVGELSGTLEKVILEINKNLKQEVKIESIKSRAYLTPKIAVVSLSICLFIFICFVIPRQQQMYARQKAEIPFITQVIFSMSDFLTEYWWLVLLLVAAGFLFFRWFAQENAETIEELKMKVPIFRPVYFTFLQYRFAAMVAILRGAGFSVIETMQQIAEIVSYRGHKDLCLNVAHAVSNGSDFYEAIKENDRENLVNPMIKNFIRTGEQSGSIPEMLKIAQEYFEIKMEDVLEKFQLYFVVCCLLPAAAGIVCMYIAIYAPQLMLFKVLRGGGM